MTNLNTPTHCMDGLVPSMRRLQLTLGYNTTVVALRIDNRSSGVAPVLGYATLHERRLRQLGPLPPSRLFLDKGRVLVEDLGKHAHTRDGSLLVFHQRRCNCNRSPQDSHFDVRLQQTGDSGDCTFHVTFDDKLRQQLLADAAYYRTPHQEYFEGSRSVNESKGEYYDSYVNFIVEPNRIGGGKTLIIKACLEQHPEGHVRPTHYGGTTVGNAYYAFYEALYLTGRKGVFYHFGEPQTPMPAIENFKAEPVRAWHRVESLLEEREDQGKTVLKIGLANMKAMAALVWQDYLDACPEFLWDNLIMVAGGGATASVLSEVLGENVRSLAMLTVGKRFAALKPHHHIYHAQERYNFPSSVNTWGAHNYYDAKIQDALMDSSSNSFGEIDWAGQVTIYLSAHAHNIYDVPDLTFELTPELRAHATSAGYQPKYVSLHHGQEDLSAERHHVYHRETDTCHVFTTCEVELATAYGVPLLMLSEGKVYSFTHLARYGPLTRKQGSVHYPNATRWPKGEIGAKLLWGCLGGRQGGAPRFARRRWALENEASAYLHARTVTREEQARAPDFDKMAEREKMLVLSLVIGKMGRTVPARCVFGVSPPVPFGVVLGGPSQTHTLWTPPIVVSAVAVHGNTHTRRRSVHLCIRAGRDYWFHPNQDDPIVDPRYTDGVVLPLDMGAPMDQLDHVTIVHTRGGLRGGHRFGCHRCSPLNTTNNRNEQTSMASLPMD